MQQVKKYIYLGVPSVICLAVILSTPMGIEYYPLSFALIIGFVNWHKHRSPVVIGILLLLVASYFSFIIAYASMFVLGELLSLIGHDTATKIAFSIGPNLIAPLLVFFTFKVGFEYHLKNRFRGMVMVAAILLLGIVFYFYLHNVSARPADGIGRTLTNPYTWWQVIMAFALQLLIYKNPPKEPTTSLKE